jgi:hypothetical protein
MSGPTNTARRANSAARQKAAAARAEQARRERRRRLWVVIGSTVAVLAVIGAIVAVGITSSGTGKAPTPRAAAPAAVVDAVTGVPVATLNTIGRGADRSTPKAVHDPALTSGSKPEVLFVGAEFCPYCAAERWAIVQALSRFGTFDGLKTVRSSPTDVYPNTATFSFHGSTFTSPVVAFVPREVETVTGATLESPTSTETALWQRYTGSPGSFPFLDIGGRYVAAGPSYDPGVLKGLSDQQIASALADPTSPVAKAVDGSANVLTAAICQVTNGQPAAVCSTPAVTAARTALSA